MTENLSTAYDAIELLESLGLPVSPEQLLQVKQLEQQYIDDVIVPHIQKECEPLLEDLMGGCHLIIDYSREKGLDIHPASDADLSSRTDTILVNSKVSSYEQDRTKYSFNGGPALPKRRCVLKVVQEYVKDHPGITFEELQRVFPDSYAGGGYYVVGKYETIQRKYDSISEFARRYFIEEDDVIVLADGTRVVVTSQWGATRFETFLGLAKRYYPNIEPVL